MIKTILIEKISKNNKSFKIKWKDGENSVFHFIWLRDNCPKAFHPTARQRTFNFLNVSENIHPKNYLINTNGNLEILWSEDNYKSIYEASWLRKNCYTINNKKKFKSPYVFWDNKLEKKINKVSLEYDEILSCDKGLIKWLDQLNVYGFSIVRNAPVKKKSALKILNKISHIRETFFGTPFEVINIPKPNNTAYTSDGLRNHTDLPYYEYAPGYQF